MSETSFNADNQNKPSFGSTEIAHKAGISLRQLYHWVDTLHVAHPQLQSHGSRKFRRFTSQDLNNLKKMKMLVQGGYTPHAAAYLVINKKELPNIHSENEEE